jgi:hypothetical protein
MFQSYFGVSSVLRDTYLKDNRVPGIWAQVLRLWNELLKETLVQWVGLRHCRVCSLMGRLAEGAAAVHLVCLETIPMEEEWRPD